MLKCLWIVVVLLVGCHDTICSCPAILSGPGWCQKAPAGGTDCAAVCPLNVPCAGYCLPDGGNPNNPMPVRCDGGAAH
jgi:hypothetical protein